MTTPSTPTVGEQLQRAREALALSLKDVAQATKIQPWILEAIERDQLIQAMNPVYAKSFLTTYAKFPQLDPSSLIVQWFPEPQEPVAVSAPTPQEPVRPSFSLPDWSWSALRAAGSVALAVALVAVIIKAKPMRWVSLKKLPHQAASLSISQPSMPTSAPKDTMLNLKPIEPLQLQITTRQSTWISVKADGRLLAQRQLAVGAQETWKARHSFELVVAKPSQTDVVLNGQSITPFLIAHRGRLIITHRAVKPLDPSQ